MKTRLKERYARQIMLPNFGEKGQKSLSKASVLIVGIGGLGSSIALYLCCAGVGHIGLIDADTVSMSNLQRQILYNEEEIGLPKVECAYRTLQRHNSDCHIDCYPYFLTQENAESIISQYDIIVDGCDNYITRYIIDDCCARMNKPFVHGCITAYSGQVSVLNGGKGKRYNDLYSDRDHLETQPRITTGVIGTTPAIIGSIEATEVIKLITGIGTPLYNKLFILDLLSMESYTLDM